MRRSPSAALLLLLIPFAASASTGPATPTFMLKWGNSGSGPGQFDTPTGVATDALGNVYVTDRALHRVQKFDRFGNFILKWGTFGIGNGQFFEPYGIATDPAGNVYVAEYGNGRIQKFTGNGTFLTKWGQPGYGNGEFFGAIGVAADAAGNVYVAEYDGNRIQKFTGNGTYLTQWGGAGAGNGQFNFPGGVATDPAGNVYVTEYNGNRIQKFDGTGTWLAKWGAAGTGAGQFDRPVGICADAVGNVYVADSYNHRIQKFTAAGGHLTQWGGQGSGDGQFQHPQSVAVDAAGNLYVTEYTGRRVQKFSGAGTGIAEAPGAFLTAWGSIGSGNSQFVFPTGIARDPAGDIYVADMANNRIQKFTSSGAYLTQWGEAGSGNGQLGSPQGVCVDASGVVTVAERNNYRIQRFTATGGYITKWGDYGQLPGYFYQPHAVAADAAGNVYVADTGNDRIQKFTPTGSFITEWGEYGTGDGEFREPIGVAIDAAGYVYVVDRYGRIQKFTENGVYLAQWGQFSGGGGLTIGADGYVYAANASSHVIQKFTNTGVLVGQFGGYGSGNGQLYEPEAVTTDPAGNIYVADVANHRIQKFVTPPSIALISDVRNDQGRQAQIRFLRCSADAPGVGVTVTGYEVYRRNDPLPAAAAAREVIEGSAPSPAGIQLAGWTHLMTAPAHGETEYNVVVPTLVDATAASLEYSAFMVRAVTSSPFTFFDSGVGDGFSVDNLPPPTPAPFLAAYLSGGTHLHWGVSPAADFETFRLYRGTTADFVPGPGNLVATLPDTGYVDVGPAGRFYKLSAVDWNGNESPFALVGPFQTTDATDAPVAFALDGVRPNPAFGGRMLVHFALPDGAPATLELLDVAGRRVRERAVGGLGAGRHFVDLSGGQRLAPGLYFLRLTQGANQRVARATLVD